MKRARRIEKLIANHRLAAQAETHDRILGSLLDTWRQHQGRRSARQRPALWEILMRKRITKLGLAAAAILVAVLLVSLLTTSSTPAYALEQTIEATRNMRWFHFQWFGGTDSAPGKEAWVERGDSGEVRSVRVNFHEPPQTQVWRQGSTQIWDQGRHRLELCEDDMLTARMIRFAERYDPRGAVEYLRRLEAKGDVRIEIRQSKDGISPVTVTVTYEPNTFLVDRPSPPTRELFSVDPQSKLIQSVEIHTSKDGVYSPRGHWRYCDYNQPFEPGLFNLEDEVPPEVARINVNQATAGLGVERGGLTKDETAIKVVREFLEALIAKDYDTAVRIVGIWHTEPERKAALRRQLENWHVVRIVSMDAPLPPPPMAGPGTLQVPCTVEVQKEGQAVEVQRCTFYPCPVPGHNDRWCVQKFDF
jgi:hypothetical protein